MQKVRIAGIVLATVFSTVFALGFIVGTLEQLGVFKAIFYAIVGVVFIWLLHFLWGRLLERAYQLGRKDALSDNEEKV